MQHCVDIFPHHHLLNKMRNLILLFLVAFTGPFLKSQSAQDTFTLEVCSRQWKTGQVIRGIRPAPDINRPMIRYDSTGTCSKFYFTPAATADQYCAEGVRNSADHVNGVSILDVIAIKNHILNIAPFSSPESYIAADMNQSGTITTLDVIAVINRLLGKTTTGIYPYSWRVITPPNALPPFFRCDSIRYIPGQNTGQRALSAIKMGDVDGDANDMQALPPVPQRPPVILAFADQTVLAGETVRVPVYLLKSARSQGMQMEIQLDTSACTLLDTILNETDPYAKMHILPADNRVRVVHTSYGGEVLSLPDMAHLFTFVIHVKKNARLSTLLSLARMDVAPLFVDEQTEVFPLQFYPLYVLTGKVHQDHNLSCTPDAGEGPVRDYPLQLRNRRTGGIQYAVSDATGKYIFGIDTGNYVLSTPGWRYWEPCLDSVSIPVLPSTGDTLFRDVFLQKTVDCPLLTVHIQALSLRRCFENAYYVDYCNHGTISAPNPHIEITLPPELTFVSSTLPPDTIRGNQVIFHPPAIEPGVCERIKIQVKAACDGLELGRYLCVEARITPDSVCVSDPRWSGAEVRVEAACAQDSVHFVVKNIGTAPTQSLEFVIIEDQVIMREDVFQLPPGGQKKHAVPANGSTWRMVADQEPYHPFPLHPTAFVEGCVANPAGSFSTGFAGQFPEQENNFTDNACLIVTGSFDPNDKQGFPTGVGTAHYVEPGTPLEYRIRFQNTGTDTAFNVAIIDTLSALLDVSSFEAGTSSHTFQWTISDGGILRFAFQNILLPDSTRNEAGSHGFVSFRIRPRTSVPLGSVIQGRAGIYFDFNAPVLTNETWHTVDTGFLTKTVRSVHPPAAPDLILSPNPVAPGTVVQCKGIENADLQMHFSDVYGREWAVVQSAAGWFQTPDVPNGIYLCTLKRAGQRVATGRLGVAR